jgi:transglutaminase-like putative cysteine protease
MLNNSQQANRRALACFVGWLVALAAVAQARTASWADPPSDRPSTEGYTISVQSVARVTATLTREASYPNLKGTEWTVFAAQAPELPGQIKVETTLDPPGEVVQEKSEMARPLVRGRVRSDKKHPINSLRMRVTYQATLRSRRLQRGATSSHVPDLSPEDRQLYLAHRGYFDFNQPEFREWIEKQGFERHANEGEIHFARRVFLALKAGMQYEALRIKDFHATAAAKCGRGDCGGLSVLFASILRSNQIPARTLWGRWAQSAEPGKTWSGRGYYQLHVKAEFFARGVGWVPVDLSSAILHDKSPQGLKFFGNDPGDFITFHVDGSLEIDTQRFGNKQVGHMQNLRWWIHGDGTLAGPTLDETWEVTRARLH